jgi:phospholipid-translocating ATPase
MEHLLITELKTRAEIAARLTLFGRQMERARRERGTPVSYALTIDGHTLAVLFAEGLDEPFREICMACDAVLCCRMSPAQKAQVCKCSWPGLLND